ncbi:MAG: sulfite exporter TauE/SafE family protein [Moraxella sp.]|nr:sulfite exporter TauE/SafE family protein [Moraxella sp.]
MNYALFAAAFSMGILGSPHCLGMCGGLVTAFGLSMKDTSPAKRRLLIGTYHAGRLTSYATLGVIASLFGAGVLEPFLTNNSLPRILLGAGLIFAALLMLGLPVLKNIEKLGLGLWQKLSPIRSKLFPLTTPSKAFTAGLLWGLLPCGLVYGALVLSVGMGATAGNPWVGAVFMLVFGLGTLPMLIATQGMTTLLQRFIKKFSLRKFSGAIMLVSGIAVAGSPVAMQYMHAGSHDHGGQSSHGNHNNASEHSTHNIHNSHATPTHLADEMPHNQMPHDSMHNSMNETSEHSTHDMSHSGH